MKWAAALVLGACATPALVDVPAPTASAAASSSAPPRATASAEPADLRVTACVESVKDGVVRVRIENRAGRVVVVPGVVFVSAPLLLDVRDAKGAAAPLGPPPMPGPGGPDTGVGPVDVFRTDVRLPSDLVKGRYTVRARTAGDITNVCEPVPFDVR